MDVENKFFFIILDCKVNTSCESLAVRSGLALLSGGNHIDLKLLRYYM